MSNAEVRESSAAIDLTRGQVIKLALWVAIALALAVLLAIALATPVMTAFGMTTSLSG